VLQPAPVTRHDGGGQVLQRAAQLIGPGRGGQGILIQGHDEPDAGDSQLSGTANPAAHGAGRDGRGWPGPMQNTIKRTSTVCGDFGNGRECLW
jgi:hypothetical protein